MDQYFYWRAARKLFHNEGEAECLTEPRLRTEVRCPQDNNSKEKRQKC